uniref:PGG domain-containing protein n=1 Tax=Caenorhabditis tropicalis TaxID=1561998 RepID=A0A1I7UAG3_9PELO
MMNSENSSFVERVSELRWSGFLISNLVEIPTLLFAGADFGRAMSIKDENEEIRDVRRFNHLFIMLSLLALLVRNTANQLRYRDAAIWITAVIDVLFMVISTLESMQLLGEALLAFTTTKFKTTRFRRPIFALLILLLTVVAFIMLFCTLRSNHYTLFELLLNTMSFISLSSVIVSGAIFSRFTKRFQNRVSMSGVSFFLILSICVSACHGILNEKLPKIWKLLKRGLRCCCKKARVEAAYGTRNDIALTHVNTISQSIRNGGRVVENVEAEIPTMEGKKQQKRLRCLCCCGPKDQSVIVVQNMSDSA